MSLRGIPNYRDLNSGGEAEQAAARMEARANEPASQRMFESLVQPLLRPETKRVLEIGCGSGALARRIARALPTADVEACDKNQTMVSVAQALSTSERLGNLRFARWDATGQHHFDEGQFDLIVSSVTVPYLTDDETEALVTLCSRLLARDGQLAFIEQDLLTDAVHANFDLFKRLYGRDERELKRTLALGLRPVMRRAGLRLTPRASFLWTDDSYGPYTRDLLSKVADDALAAGRISSAERTSWHQELESLAAQGDFYYGLVYHRIVGTKP